MNIGGAGGGLFDLSASISIDLGSYESEIDTAVSEAEDLSDALSDIDDVDADVTVDVEGDDDVNDLSDDMNDIDDVDADVNVDVEGGDDVAEVSDNISCIEGSADTASGGVSSLTDNIVNGLAGVATIAALTSLSGKIAQIVGDVTQSADEIDKQSQVLGISRQAYQEWSYVLGQSGIPISVLTKGMIKLTNGIGEGKEEFTDALSEIGLSTKQLESMSPEDRFSAIVEGIQGLPEGMDKAAVATALFGDRLGNQLMPFLNTTAEDTAGLVEEAHGLGMIMTDDEISNAVAYGDALDRFNKTVEGLKADLVGSIIPALTDFMTTMGDLIGMFTGDDQTLTGNIERIGTAFSGTIADINGQQLNAEAIITAMEKMGDPNLFTEEDAQVYQRLYDSLILINPSIAESYGTVATAVYGLTDDLRENTAAFLVNARAQALQDAITARYQAMSGAYEDVTNKLVAMRIAQETMTLSQGAATEATQNYMDQIAGTKFESVAKQFIDGNGVLDFEAYRQEVLRAGVNQAGQVNGYDSAFITPEASDQEALTSYNTALDECTTATEAYTAASEELASQEAATETWVQALTDVASMDMSGTSESIDSVTTASESAQSAGESFASSLTTQMGNAATKVTTYATKMKTALDKIPRTIRVSTTVSGTGTDGSHADGLDYVPFDGYIAELHRGERVLTASEAAAYNKGGMSNADLGVVVEAILNRPIAFSVGANDLAVSTRSETTRASAAQTARIASGFGKGAL